MESLYILSQEQLILECRDLLDELLDLGGKHADVFILFENVSWKKNNIFDLIKHN